MTLYKQVITGSAHYLDFPRMCSFQMGKLRNVVDELQSRVIDCAVEKASKATLQSVLDQHELLIQDVERELSSLTLLRQYALSLLHDVEVPSPSPTSEQDELPSLKEIRAVQDRMERCRSRLLGFAWSRPTAAVELHESGNVLHLHNRWIGNSGIRSVVVCIEQNKRDNCPFSYKWKFVFCISQPSSSKTVQIS